MYTGEIRWESPVAGLNPAVVAVSVRAHTLRLFAIPLVRFSEHDPCTGTGSVPVPANCTGRTHSVALLSTKSVYALGGACSQ